MRTPTWLFMLTLVATAASAQEPPLVTIDSLGLIVSGAKVLPEVKGLMGNKLSAKAGNRLAVVSLAGKASGPCRLKLLSSEFSAAYATSPDSGGKAESAVAGAIGIDGMWLFAEGVEYAQTVTLPKAGPVQIEIAVSVPLSVKEFDLHHRGASKGRAVLEATAAVNPALPQAVSAALVNQIEMGRNDNWRPKDPEKNAGVLVLIRLSRGEFGTEEFSLSYKGSAPPARPAKANPTVTVPCRGYRAGRSAWAITDEQGKGFKLYTGNPTTDIDFLFEVPRTVSEVTLEYRGKATGAPISVRPLP